MTSLTEDEIVERVYRAHGNSPTPQLRPVLRRIWAAGLSIVEADGEPAATPTTRLWTAQNDSVTDGETWLVVHAPPSQSADIAVEVAAALNAADPGPDTTPERT